MPVRIRCSMSSMETVFSRPLRRPNSQSTRRSRRAATAKITPAIITSSREIDMGFYFYPAFFQQRMPNFMMIRPLYRTREEMCLLRSGALELFSRERNFTPEGGTPTGLSARLTMTLHSSPMGRSGHRDDRRRRLLAEDRTANAGLPAQSISGTLPHNDHPPAHKSQNYGDAEFLQTQLRLTDLVPRRLISHLLLLMVGLAAIGGLMALYVWIPDLLHNPQIRPTMADLGNCGSLGNWFASLLLLTASLWQSWFIASADIKLTIIVDIITYGSGLPHVGSLWRPTWRPVFIRAFSK